MDTHFTDVEAAHQAAKEAVQRLALNLDANERRVAMDTLTNALTRAVMYLAALKDAHFAMEDDFGKYQKEKKFT